jgi:hypothetical protein
MTNREIYNNSLALIGESLNSEYVEDYEERAPYIIASVASHNLMLDRRIRAAEALSTAHSFSPVYLSLDLDFPLCDRLAFPAALYVASLLVIDEDPDLSDTLYDKYCDAVSTLETSYSSGDAVIIPPSSEGGGTIAGQATRESIVEKYFHD